MLLETRAEKPAEVIGHVCNAHSNWETVPRQVRRALFIGAEIRPFLIRWVHCDFFHFTMGRCYITQRGDVNGNAIVVKSSRAT
ncbi:hypothetical protein [Neptunicoccus cionae]|uniref:hypothetical protein n=1 Tax=Neptunicoccus cionae TaxID=2035344 RepID=UPI0015E07EB7|nr:hypothetical protein [Amylibacter cionae]